MINIFGRNNCPACQAKKKELDNKGIEYIYHDLDSAHGLAEATYRGLSGRSLPIIINEEDED